MLKKCVCVSCEESKFHKLPFEISSNIASNLFDLIHVYLCGPYKLQEISGAKYFFTIVDDCSRAT